MRRLLKNIVLVLGFACTLLLFNKGVNAQEIKSKAILDTTQMLAGDQIKLRLELELPKGMNVSFPTPPDSLTEVIEILSRTPVDTLELKDHRLLISQEYLITAFDSGVHIIPEFNFELRYNELTEQITSNDLALAVHSIPVDMNKGPVDIALPYEAPITFIEVAPLLSGILLGIAIIFLIIYAIRRRSKNKPIFVRPPKPKEPAHIIALRDLDAIKKEDLWQKGKVKEYYTKVSEVLRTYLEDRYGIHTFEKTSVEILADLRNPNLQFEQQPYSELKQLFETADLVKFAKYSPQPDVNNLMMLNATLIVEQTKQEERKPAEVPVDDREGEDVVLK